ncbi:MAG TPA: SMP-30/gluconolactonase/LRE family protein [Burkholderiaceae bacterium]|nr:SMP-30/gluconolactonase/LRE family protein [Burkholderiaceae bacterium]
MKRGAAPAELSVDKVVVEGLVFPEGPRWHAGELWFSDMLGGAVMRVGVDGKLHQVLEVPGQPSGLGWLPDGRMLVVSMRDRRLLRRDAGAPSVVADLSRLAPQQCNDMVVDAHGRAYIGNFGFDLPGGATPVPTGIVLVTPDGAARVVADGLLFPNGSVITPDGETLIVGETFGARLTSYKIAPDGSLHSRQTWAALPGKSPDGICLDAEGAIWVASPATREVLRVRPGGEITHRVATERQAIACMLGGADRRELFILSGHVSFDPVKARKYRSGAIESVQVDVPGAGLP